MTRRLLLFTVVVLSLVSVAPAQAHRYPASKPCAGRALHVGHPGPLRCLRAAQWLLRARDPAVRKGSYWRVYRGPLAYSYGRKTAASVRRVKFRLGFPTKYVSGHFGPVLRAYLLGKRKVPLSYSIRATKRRAVFDRPKCTGTGRMLSIARSYVGVREQPLGSNDGPTVRIFQASTGAYRAPWCVSYLQHVIRKARAFGSIAPGVGRLIADGSAGVFYVVGWARNRGWLRSSPLPGDLVAFMDRLGHIGIIESTGRGGFTSIEGNASDSVLRRYHTFRRNLVFIRLPNSAKRIACSR